MCRQADCKKYCTVQYLLRTFRSIVCPPLEGRSAASNAENRKQKAAFCHRTQKPNLAWPKSFHFTRASSVKTINIQPKMPPKRVKKVMTVPINVIFSHLQVRTYGTRGAQREFCRRCRRRSSSSVTWLELTCWLFWICLLDFVQLSYVTLVF